MNNLHPIGRFARVVAGIALLEPGYFWLAGVALLAKQTLF